MAVDDRLEAQEAAERTFAILTARYHGMDDDLDVLLAELTLDQARRVIRLMAALLGGTFTFAEKLECKARGTVLPEVVRRLRRDTPWMR